MDALLLPDPALLPDDPAVLKQLVVQLLEELQKANARLERQEHHMHLLLKGSMGARARSSIRDKANCSILSQARKRVPRVTHAAARLVAGFAEARPARSRADSREDQA